MLLNRSTAADALAKLELAVEERLHLESHPALRPIAVALDQAVNLVENHVANNRPIPYEHKDTVADQLVHARKIADTLETLAEAAHLMVDGLTDQLRAYEAHLAPILEARAAAFAAQQAAEEVQANAQAEGSGSVSPEAPTPPADPVEPEPEAPPETPLQGEPEAAPKRKRS